MMPMGLAKLGFAAASPVEAMGKQFGRDVSVSYYVLGVIGFIVIVAAWQMLARYHRRQTAPPPLNAPLALFRELCAIHRLDQQEQVLLTAMAGQLRDVPPAAMIAMPSVFDAVGDRLINATALPADHLDRIPELRAKLFAV